LHKTLNKFLIGAMQHEAMMTYTEADSLLIVRNRTKVHELALKAGAAVLITGGFDTADYIKKLADEKQLPIMSTRYDTYTVASMINRAIDDQMIKREIVFVEDIYTPFESVHYLHPDDQVKRWYELNHLTTHTRFPVIDERKRLKGMVTSKDIIGKDHELTIEAIMSHNPVTVKEKTSLAFISHTMVWEGVEIIPVIDQQKQLCGIISRQDVLEALQQVQHQPQHGETLDDIVASKLNVKQNNCSTFSLKVTPQMTNQIGTLSHGVLTTIITESSRQLLLHLRKGDMVVENLTTYFIKPVQIDSLLTVHPKILEIGHAYAKIDSEIYDEEKIVGKGLLTVQLIEHIEGR
ncbi:MAG TPA: DRTGG domain-containing protein, partial [Bacillota bacterium]|nr:DRTGG domain-containing protein [Bacillota bacterium]